MLQKVCNALQTVIVAVLLVTAGLLLLPSVFGFKSFAVLSGSMTPEIGVGEMVYARETDAAELEVGDIITYRLSESTVVTHRIAELHPEEGNVITKGDANESVDGTPVTFDQVIGRVGFHVPLLGYVSMYMKTPVGIAVLCGVAMVLIILCCLPGIFGGKEAAAEKAATTDRETAAAEEETADGKSVTEKS